MSRTTLMVINRGGKGSGWIAMELPPVQSCSGKEAA